MGSSDEQLHRTAGRAAVPPPLTLLLLLIPLLLLAPSPGIATEARPPRTHGGQVGQRPAPLVFYNRIGKAGSTTIWNLVSFLRRRNKFELLYDTQYYTRQRNQETAARLFRNARKAGRPALYICHTFYLDFQALPRGAISDVLYINVIRNPIQRYRSAWNYMIDPVARGGGQEWGRKAVALETQRRQADPCGCANVSFDECMEQAHISNCSANADISKRLWSNTMVYFLSEQDSEAYEVVNCNPKAAAPLVEKALANMDKYAVIGLTERMQETLGLLEARLPAVFAGAVNAYQSRNKPRYNQGGSAKSAPEPGLSAAAEAILRDNPCNAGEFALWEHAKQLFHTATGVNVSGL
mmetsp:Transcript_22893/g.57414  ORF Transcript_22893/g.57414 Transcript_22893/m.57414 type:complete len:353 (-) Transcript_22893:356-1414(-)